MASKKKSPSRKADDRRILYCRVTPAVYKKLQRLAAQRTQKVGHRVTMQDTVVALIQSA